MQGLGVDEGTVRGIFLLLRKLKALITKTLKVSWCSTLLQVSLPLKEYAEFICAKPLAALKSFYKTENAMNVFI